MISTFYALKAQYASNEITMADLDAMQQFAFIRFENRGISRSQTDCLLCEVHCEPLEELLLYIKNGMEKTQECLRTKIKELGLVFTASIEDASLLTLRSTNDLVEIIATVDEKGAILVDMDDITAESVFQVYLRVQH